MLYKVLIRSCTRCGGDLFLEREDDGLYFTCIQCGAVENKLTRLLQIGISSHVGESEDGDWWKQRKSVGAGERCQ